MRIRLFGGLAVERDGHIIHERDWRRSNARALFSLLLLHPSGLTREQVYDILWPDYDEPTAAQALKTALSILRRILEPSVSSACGHVGSQRFPLRERLVRLRLFPSDWLDIRLFMAPPDPGQLTLSALTDIVALYGGELLPDYRYDDWAATARESLRGRWHALSLHLAQRLAMVEQAVVAMQHAQAVLLDDGTQEEAARLLMTLYAEQGQRGAALQVYQNLVETLRHEIGVAPDPVTRALAERLHDDETAVITPIPSLHETSERIQRRIADLVARPANAARARRLARLQAEHALVLVDLGQPELARSAMESGQLLLESLDFPAEQSRLLIAESMVWFRHGQSRQASEAAAQAERLAGVAGERNLVGWARRVRSQAEQAMGRPDDAIALARSSAALFESMGAPEQRLRSNRVLAFALWRAGRFAEAVTLQRHNLAEARVLRDAEMQAYVLCNLGSDLWAQGAVDEAEGYLLESQALATRLGDAYLVLSTEYQLGNLWAERAFLLQDSGGEAMEMARRETWAHFDRAIQLAREQDSAFMLAGGANDLAIALIEWDQVEQARPFADLARQVTQNIDHAPTQGWGHLCAAELALADGVPHEAMTHATNALSLLARGSPMGLAQAHRAAALACTAQGKDAEAEPHWMASLSSAKRYGQVIEEARTRRARATARR